jgi:hypothetical protein
VKPAKPPLAQYSGSGLKSRCRRCALADAVNNIAIKNAREKRLIIRLQVVLQLARVVG